MWKELRALGKKIAESPAGAWDEIQERVRATVAKSAEITAVWLGKQRDILVDTLERVNAELVGAPGEGKLIAKRKRAILLSQLLIPMALAAWTIAYMSFQPFPLDQWNWAAATGLVVFTVVAIEMFLVTKEKPYSVLFIFSAFASAALLLANMALAHIRAEMIVESVRSASEAAPIVDFGQTVADQAATTEADPFLARVLANLKFCLPFLALGMELVLGAFFHYVVHAVWNTHLLNYKRARRLKEQIAVLEEQMEREIAKSQVFDGEVEMGRAEAIAKAKRWPFGRKLSLIVAAVLFILMLLTFLAGGVHAQGTAGLSPAENIACLLDLSLSLPPEEFNANVRGCYSVLGQVQPGTRALVLGITDDAWAKPRILLDARVSSDPGWMDRNIKLARRKFQEAWAAKAKELRPEFQDSDIIGAIGLAARLLHFCELHPARVYIYSDMRQTRGVNLEKPSTIPEEPMLQKAADLGLIPYLKGARIWVLGVHTHGKSQQYWKSLHCFWTHWFALSKGKLMNFDIQRNLDTLGTGNEEREEQQASTGTSANGNSATRCLICGDTHCSIRVGPTVQVVRNW